ncbi:MAG: hypothetical protein HY530_06265 [Chloroflexi bacterium]|nr:hypothetical protein [Chloroflexota bacterium]
MCDLCGCKEYIRQGKQAVLRRAEEIVGELGVAAQNVDDFEDTELISQLIVPFGSRDDEVYQASSWVSSLHMGMKQVRHDERYQAHARAFRDIFSRLPVKGEPKHIATVYHQLEQLSRELDEAELASIAPGVREAVKAVKRVHDGVENKLTRLKLRYGL